jgi:uncharacterized lipoprotein YmbA
MRLGSGTLAVASFVFLTGCSVLDPRPDSSRYFLLRAMAPPADAETNEGLVLGLGPFTMPEHLDRYEMLEFVGTYELRYSATNRWIEPLGGQVRRTLAENLEAILRPDAVFEYPWYATDGVDLQIALEFDPIRLGGDGVWRGGIDWLMRDSAGAIVDRGHRDFEVGPGSVAPEAAAEAWSGELELLAQQIADAVTRNPPPQGDPR